MSETLIKQASDAEERQYVLEQLASGVLGFAVNAAKSDNLVAGLFLIHGKYGVDREIEAVRNEKLEALNEHRQSEWGGV